MPASKVINEISQKLKENGLHFSGNELQGTLEGHGVSGQYHINDNNVNITLHKKPFFVSWKYVEALIRNYVEDFQRERET